MTRNIPGWAINGLTVLALLASAALVGGCESRTDRCIAQGGVVEDEIGTKTKVKNGKLITERHTEYECIVNGQEVDEWKV